MAGETADETFYTSLISIIEIEGEKLKENATHLTSSDMSSVTTALSRIRNSFYKNSSNQKMVAENEAFRSTLVRFLKYLIDLYPFLNDVKENKTKQNIETLKYDLDDLMSLCITTFVNMMAGNSAIRKIIWPFIQSSISDIVSLPSTNVCHMGAALFHQFLLEDELKQEILKSGLATVLIPSLLKNYIIEGPHSCFSLFCLETIIEAPEAVSSTWEKLSLKESLLLVDILTTMLQKGTIAVPLPVVQFMQELFKKDADRIFALHDDRMTPRTPIAIIRVTNFLSCAASSDCFRTHLQKDKSLLISCVYLLKGITDIGDSSQNTFSRVQDNDRMEGELDSHPAFGLKSDLIRLIAGLVYRNKSNQDAVREIDGILLLLENSQYDARNPLIREASIFALRNLLEGNSENQEVISGLQLQDVAENKGLDQLGLAVTIQDGKVSLHQK